MRGAGVVRHHVGQREVLEPGVARVEHVHGSAHRRDRGGRLRQLDRLAQLPGDDEGDLRLDARVDGAADRKGLTIRDAHGIGEHAVDRLFEVHLLALRLGGEAHLVAGDDLAARDA